MVLISLCCYSNTEKCMLTLVFKYYGHKPPAIAIVNQTINSGAPAYTSLPTIVGSVNVRHSAINFPKDNPKTSFLQASEIAGKQVPNGTIVAGHLGVIRGYLIYTFFIVNTQDQTRHLGRCRKC